MEVVDSEKPRAEHFVFHHQVADVAPAEIFAGITCAAFLERSRVVFVGGIPDMLASTVVVEVGVTRQSGGVDAVEHIHAAFHGFENIFRRTNTHEVAWFIFGIVRMYDVEDAVHGLAFFTHAQSADGDTRQIHLGTEFGRFNAQVVKNDSLDDGEKRLFGIAFLFLERGVFFPATVEPGMGPFHRFPGVFVR